MIRKKTLMTKINYTKKSFTIVNRFCVGVILALVVVPVAPRAAYAVGFLARTTVRHAFSPAHAMYHSLSTNRRY